MSRDCPRCDGDKVIECPHCEGSGYEPGTDDTSLGGWVEAGVEAVHDVVFGPDKCHVCNGNEEIKCPRCEGEGVIY